MKFIYILVSLSKLNAINLTLPSSTPFRRSDHTSCYLRNMARRAKKKQPKRRSSRAPKRGRASNFVVGLHKLKPMKQGQRINALKMANNAFIREFTQQAKKLKHAQLSPTLRTRMRRQSKTFEAFWVRKQVCPPSTTYQHSVVELCHSCWQFSQRSAASWVVSSVVSKLIRLQPQDQTIR